MPGGECGVGTVLPLPSCVMGCSILGLKRSGDVLGLPHTGKRSGSCGFGSGFSNPEGREAEAGRSVSFPPFSSSRCCLLRGLR